MLTATFYEDCNSEDTVYIPISMKVFAPFPGVDLGRIYNLEQATLHLGKKARQFREKLRIDVCNAYLELEGSNIELEFSRETDMADVQACIEMLLDECKKKRQC